MLYKLLPGIVAVLVLEFPLSIFGLLPALTAALCMLSSIAYGIILPIQK